MVTHTMPRRPWRARLSGVLSAAIVALVVSATPVAAQQAQTGAPSLGDRIDLVGLTTRQPAADAPANQVQFQATVNYRLSSQPTGFVLLFLFENSDANSTQDSSNAITVQRGTGQLVLNIDYTLRPNVKTLTLVAGVFKGEQKLLAWVSTNPVDMAPWPGRVSFEKAMAARLDDNFTAADAMLSQAIQDAPDTGNYYYWRGDTRIRLQDYSDALVDFNKSIELMPADRPSRVGRGIAQLWLGDASGAVNDLSVAISSAQPPDRVSAWAYRARGLAYASEGQSTQAIADYRAYLDLSPNATDREQVAGWIADLQS